MNDQQKYYQTSDGKFHPDTEYGFTHLFSEGDPWYDSFFIIAPFIVLSYAAIIYLFGILVGVICLVGLPVVLLIYRETLPEPKLYTEDEIRSM